MAVLGERLAALEAREADRDRRIDGHAKTLYGAAGNGGLQQDVHAVALSHTAHVKATDQALDKMTSVLVGAGTPGADGLVGDVGRLTAAAKLRSRLLWLFLGAAVAEATALAILGLRSLQ